MPDADGTPPPEEAAPTIAAARQQQADATALQEQLTQAQARNLELEVAALHTANPDLPDAAFPRPGAPRPPDRANRRHPPPGRRTRRHQGYRPHQVRPRPEELTNGPDPRRSRQV